MKTPVIHTKSVSFAAAASAGQSLPDEAMILTQCTLITAPGTAYATVADQAIVTGAPAAGQVQFTGTGNSPSSSLTFHAALVATDELLVQYVPVGALPAA